MCIYISKEDWVLTVLELVSADSLVYLNHLMLPEMLRIFLPSEFQGMYLRNSVCCHHQLFIFPVLSCVYYIAESTIRAAASLNNKQYKTQLSI